MKECKLSYRCGFKVGIECKYEAWCNKQLNKHISKVKPCNDNQYLGGFMYNSLRVDITTKSLILTAGNTNNFIIKDIEDILMELDEKGIDHKFDSDDNEFLYDTTTGYRYKTNDFQEIMEQLLNGKIGLVEFRKDADYMPISDIIMHSRNKRTFDIDFYKDNNKHLFVECLFLRYEPKTDTLFFDTGLEDEAEISGKCLDQIKLTNKYY